MVLTSKKPDPKVSMPLSAGAMQDPILAHWQAGLGKSAVFTSDATGKWAPQWVQSAAFSKFWWTGRPLRVAPSNEQRL